MLAREQDTIAVFELTGCIKNEKFCIKIEELCIKNEEILY